MANTLTNILDKILARGLMTLREAAVMPRLTNIDYQPMGAQQGNTIDVPRPVAQAVSTVAASNTLKAAADKAPSLVQVTLDQWKMTDFYLTDKELTEIDRNRHFMPMQTAEAARALANVVDQHIYGKYRGIYGYTGTAGVVPFSTVATITNARKVLNQQLAPLTDRRMVMDPTAEAQALQLQAYHDISQSGDRQVKIEGEVGRKFGFDHFMSQNVLTHTRGTNTASAQVASTTAIGVSTLKVKGKGALGTVVLGDIFTIAGQTQTYVFNATATLTSAGVNISIDPPLKVIASANSVITIKSSHVVNLAFNRNAFVYVTRPLADAASGLMGGNPVSVLADDITQLALRLEVVRQHKQNAFQFDILWGAKLVRPEFACRVAD